MTKTEKAVVEDTTNETIFEEGVSTEKTEKTEKNDVVSYNSAEGLTLMDEMQQDTANFYSSLDMNNEESSIILYNALNMSCDDIIKNVIGQELMLKDVILRKYQKADLETGEVKDRYLSVLVTEDGKSYATGAYGIFFSLKTLFKIFGLPEIWTKSLPIRVIEKKIDKGTTYEIELIRK